jgi:peptidoglycan/LPS O-acetylase OafA/YrhL
LCGTRLWPIRSLADASAFVDPNLVWNGNYGVTVFFVISGYLITSTSLRRFGSLERVSAKTFYAFRFARIFPCLLLVLTMITGLALAGIEIFRGNAQVSIWLSDLSILTFWHNVMMAKFGYFNYCLNVLWSLSVEEVFYIAFPLLCLILRRSRWIVLVWVAAIVAGPIYRSYNSHNEILFLYGYLACCCSVLPILFRADERLAQAAGWAAAFGSAAVDRSFSSSRACRSTIRRGRRWSLA